MGCWADSCRLYCSVSEVHFGPVCRSDDEAYELLHHVWRTRGMDPRALGDYADLDKALAEVRDGTGAKMPTHEAVQCFCGSRHMRRGLMWTGGVEYRSCGACGMWVSCDGRVYDKFPVPNPTARGAA